MRHAENIAAVATLDIDLMGFIFFAKSPRYVSNIIPTTPDNIGRVGVFVDESLDTIVQIAQRHSLTHLQLHGTESPELCLELKTKDYTIIKAFQIANADSFVKCIDYEDVTDMLLFDTACTSHGGSGKKFDWSLLDSYTGKLPYILSGGISLETAGDITQIKDPRLWGVDLNSCFEQAPALKDTEKLNQFINQLKHQYNESYKSTFFREEK